jgi:general secretion pathway protein A
LTRQLEAEVRVGHRSALVVDEAHALPDEVLEEIRLLANIETDDEKMLPIVLAGQTELGDRLNEPRFRQLKQRVALRCALGALRLRETATYLAGRIGVARGDPAGVFTKDAVILIHEASRGLPRTINVICDNALVAGFGADERPVTAQIVRTVCQSLDLLPARPSSIIRPQPVPAADGANGARSRSRERVASPEPQRVASSSVGRLGSFLHLLVCLWVM